MQQRWRGRLGLRGRLTVLSVVAFAVALAVMSAVLYAVLVWTGERSLTNDQTTTTAQVADLVETSRLPDPIPATGSQLVQVVDPRLRGSARPRTRTSSPRCCCRRSCAGHWPGIRSRWPGPVPDSRARFG